MDEVVDITTLKCRVCRKKKPLDKMRKSKRSKYGHENICLICNNKLQNEYNHIYNFRHVEEMKEYKHQYYLRSKKEIRLDDLQKEFNITYKELVLIIKTLKYKYPNRDKYYNMRKEIAEFLKENMD